MRKSNQSMVRKYMPGYFKKLLPGEKAWIFDSFLVLCLVPWIVLITTKISSQPNWQIFIYLVAFWVIYLFIFLVITNLLKKISSALFIFKFFYASLTGTYFIIFLLFVGYKWSFVGADFDLLLLWDSMQINLSTALKLTDRISLLSISLGILLVWFVITGINHRMLNFLSNSSNTYKAKTSKIIWIISTAIFLTLIIPAPYASPINQIKYLSTVLYYRYTFKPVQANYPKVDIQKKQNILILQLESFNGFLLQGNLPNGNHFDYLEWIPNFSEISSQGILFPQAVASSVQTNRAMESLFCGVAGNIRSAYSFKPNQLKYPCWPKILSENSYQTIFLSSFYDGDFMNLENFLHEIGFEDIHFADFMDKDDDFSAWGYDDCQFYSKAMQLLSKKLNKSNDPRLVYLETGSHHFPFGNKSNQGAYAYAQLNKNFTVDYLQSLKKQDKCLENFYQLFQSSIFDDYHLIITADTSWPIGFHDNISIFSNSYNDNIYIPILYLPPRISRVKQLNKVIELPVSQANIGATIMELLSGENISGSFYSYFEPDLNKEKICSVFTQPYGEGSISVFRYPNKFVYSISKKQVSIFNLEQDPMEKYPEIVNHKLSLQAFKKQYFCDYLK